MEELKNMEAKLDDKIDDKPKLFKRDINNIGSTTRTQTRWLA